MVGMKRGNILAILHFILAIRIRIRIFRMGKDGQDSAGLGAPTAMGETENPAQPRNPENPSSKIHRQRSLWECPTRPRPNLTITANPQLSEFIVSGFFAI